MEKPDPDLNEERRKNFLWQFYLWVVAGILMLIGVIVSFFNILWAGLLVGLAIGISFFDETWGFFSPLRGYYLKEGIFKSLMLVGLLIYFLISIPLFVLAFIVGFGFMYLIRWTMKKMK